jgi:hypothetical protein
VSRAPVEQAADPAVGEVMAHDARAEAPAPTTTARDRELIMHLERDQLVSETFRPVARARLSRPVMLSLWALRIFAVLLALMVIYTFVARLH